MTTSDSSQELTYPDARVLVVEDDLSQRVLLRRILQTVGITQVQFEGDPRRILDVVETFDPDVVTLDVHLPGGDVFDVLGQLAERDPYPTRRRVLIVTGDTDPEVAERARSLGTHGIVYKPYVMRELLEELTRLILDGRRAHERLVEAATSAVDRSQVEHSTGEPTAMGLTQVVRDLADARTVDDVAALVRSAARQLTGADGATFVLRDGDECHYLDEDAISPLWKGQRFPMSTCISGWAMQHHEIAVIEDIYLDDRIPHDAYRPTFVKSLVMVPIRTEDPIGAIGTYWATRRRPTSGEVRLLQALADSTAVALQNVLLYTQLDTVRERTAELASSNDQLRDFVYAVAHDIRSPLSTIQGLAEVLLTEDAPRSPDTAQAIHAIRRSATSLSNFVSDLLDFAIADGRVIENEVLLLSDLVGDVTDRLAAPITDRSATITLVNDDEFIGDRVMLTQVLQNLIANALAYVPGDREPIVHIEIARTVVGWDLTVGDNGNGVPHGERQMIFEPFRRGTSSVAKSGTGLGLALCRRVVDRHGGTITVRDGVAGGAEFVVSVGHDSS